MSTELIINVDWAAPETKDFVQEKDKNYYLQVNPVLDYSAFTLQLNFQETKILNFV